MKDYSKVKCPVCGRQGMRNGVRDGRPYVKCGYCGNFAVTHAGPGADRRLDETLEEVRRIKKGERPCLRQAENR